MAGVVTYLDLDEQGGYAVVASVASILGLTYLVGGRTIALPTHPGMWTTSRVRQPRSQRLSGKNPPPSAGRGWAHG